jgi:hypothetical protein
MGIAVVVYIAAGCWLRSVSQSLLGGLADGDLVLGDRGALRCGLFGGRSRLLRLRLRVGYLNRLNGKTHSHITSM